GFQPGSQRRDAAGGKRGFGDGLQQGQFLAGIGLCLLRGQAYDLDLQDSDLVDHLAPGGWNMGYLPQNSAFCHFISRWLSWLGKQFLLRTRLYTGKTLAVERPKSPALHPARG